MHTQLIFLEGQAYNICDACLERPRSISEGFCRCPRCDYDSTIHYRHLQEKIVRRVKNRQRDDVFKRAWEGECGSFKQTLSELGRRGGCSRRKKERV